MRPRVPDLSRSLNGPLSLDVLGDTLVDATVKVYGGDGKEAARGRTYAKPENNPRSWVILPGTYSIKVREVGGEKPRQDLTLDVSPGATTERIVELE